MRPASYRYSTSHLVSEAGIEPATPRFSGESSTSELPGLSPTISAGDDGKVGKNYASEPISRILSWTIIHLCPTSPLGCAWVASPGAVPRFTRQLHAVSSLLATPSPRTLLRGGRLIKRGGLVGSPDFPLARHLRPCERSSSPLTVLPILLLRCVTVCHTLLWRPP